MADGNWQQVKEIFNAAVQQKPEERGAFLEKACGGDKLLRREVESLLSAYGEAESFMEKPAAEEIADVTKSGGKNKFEQGRCFGHYEIAEQIGAGGMGEVYLARDKKLDRPVAIKILNEKFARHESNLQRFIKEAKSASALNHPNILVIHEIGESEDSHYIVSEFIEGKTLRDRFKESPMKLAEVLDIAIQIASALTVAHAAKIVHRDIKPENIIVRPDGLVKILDFGLAKLVGQKSVGFEESTLKQNQTAKGIILGTVNYMSPEQAKGEKVDGRSDIFSLGVVIYEMIAGQTPFEGGSVSETFANLINAEPQPLVRYAANIPNELQRIVSKMLRKNAGERYQTMKDVLTDLKDLRENLTFEEKIGRSARSGERATEVLYATTGEAKRQTAETKDDFKRVKNYKPLVVLALLVSLVGVISLGYYFWSAGKSSPNGKKTLAVLPFVNASQDPNAEYLSDGITESLINNLSQLSALKVMSRNSTFRFKDNQTDTRSIASQLGVENIITGDIKQVGDRFVINVRLIDATDDSQIWGNQYVKTPSDIIVIQNEIARDVWRNLGARFSLAYERTLAKKITDNPKAYQLFLKGRYHFEKYNPQDARKALDYFQQAITLDPNLAAAYANIGSVHLILASSKDFPHREAILKAKEYALKAISFDDQTATAHEVLGHILLNDYDFAGAEREFKRALEIDPNDASTRESYGGLLIPLGRHEEALAEMRLAEEINPLSPTLTTSVGNSFLHTRRYDEAIAQYKKALDLDAYFIPAHLGLAIVYQMQRKYAESVEERAMIAESAGNKQGAAFMRRSFEAGGWQGFLREMTENPQAPQAPPYIKATMNAELGEKDKAFEILNRLYEDRSSSIVLLNVDPRLDNLRDDLRFQDLLNRVGLPQ